MHYFFPWSFCSSNINFSGLFLFGSFLVNNAWLKAVSIKGAFSFFRQLHVGVVGFVLALTIFLFSVQL